MHALKSVNLLLCTNKLTTASKTSVSCEFTVSLPKRDDLKGEDVTRLGCLNLENHLEIHNSWPSNVERP